MSATSPTATRGSMMTRNMGMFDFISGAFQNEDIDDRRATASHILVETEEEAMVVKKSILDGDSSSFEEAAKTYSTCPSSKEGGSLGTFQPGAMVQEFDDVCFNKSTPIGEIIGPIQSKFGYHLIVVADRFENADKTDGDPFF
eukprot:CAMPEP_0198252980 /NCGR_PEP_ID=MMETSP1447-20131203/3452_1 /TAXON_ID=420782 /ORGANISM="Chaetoceros dichaeta, Strain CCMP1751" /LENGTH=142 /DNA_ID=CAMNT_0043938441 /DNA_START=148 /DNA_END=576 /DNA_ORIENTATION=+